MGYIGAFAVIGVFVWLVDWWSSIPEITDYPDTDFPNEEDE